MDANISHAGSFRDGRDVEPDDESIEDTKPDTNEGDDENDGDEENEGDDDEA